MKRIRNCNHAGTLLFWSKTYICWKCGMQADFDYKGDKIQVFVPTLLMKLRNANGGTLW